MSAHYRRPSCSSAGSLDTAASAPAASAPASKPAASKPATSALAFSLSARSAWLSCFLLAAACVDPRPGSQAAEAPPEQQVSRLAIDPGQVLELEPGTGVGVAVTYAEDGTWNVSTACDTLTTGALCEFDILVHTGGEDELIVLDDAQLEGRDDAFYLDPFALELLLQTGDDIDTVTLGASPGALLRLTVWLYDPIVDSRFDWTRDPRLISWIGHGAVHWGAPTNPVDLQPATP